MKNFIKLGLGFLSVAMLAVSCSDDESPAVDLKLSADKETIAADGTDAVKFTVKNGGTDVTASAKIYNQTDKVYLESNEFSSDTEGSYTFVAEYDNAKSNTVNVTVGTGTVSALVLNHDKNEVTADGTDAVTFTVTYDGEDVTTEAEVLNKTDNTPLELTDGVFSFSTATAGSYEFVATYGEYTAAPVTITAVAAGGASFNVNKTPYRYALITKVTGTWCPACPSAATAIHQVEGNYPDRMVEIAIHHNGGRSDPYEARPYADNFVRHYNVQYFPTIMVDLDPDKQTNQTASALLRFVKNSVEEIPTIVGIAATSKVEGEKAVVSVKVGTKEAGEVQLMVAVVEDGIIGYQSSGGSNYEHNCTLRTATADLYTGESLGELSKGQEVTKEYQFDLNATWNVDNLRVVAYAVIGTNVGGEIKRFVNNAVSCPINGSVDYRYEAE